VQRQSGTTRRRLPARSPGTYVPAGPVRPADLTERPPLRVSCRRCIDLAGYGPQTRAPGPEALPALFVNVLA
jgi:hypothetical protein